MEDLIKEVTWKFNEIKSWRLLYEPNEAGPLSYGMEEAVGEMVAQGEAPATIRVWQGPRSLVVAKKDLRAPNGLKAAQMMKQVDWPVYVRQSGGTAVPHGPGTLNLSLFLPRPKEMKWNIDDIYRMLGVPIIEMLKNTFGLHSYFGEVPGSFCDGRYNVVVQGKKIVGTSQIWKGGPAGLTSRRPGYILAHATLLTWMDRQEAVSALNAFYELAEGSRPVYIDTVATLSSFVPGTPDEVEKKATEGIFNAVRSLTGVDEIQSPTEKEWVEAETYRDRCFPEFYEMRTEKA
ncbi:lipoate--protein ligase family protein [Melghirimyces algeriensis]|uniref:Lipoate-protein ligase A n=1 Tax=Melghirimyces algeriensis TaxID=910412 RepID=A0A521DJT4_9BACL|nr:ligase [Melghirimyces algeriensis]SMO71979.1 Lipoate-protein ligase A [Melghirimyces algeriensis]